MTDVSNAHPARTDARREAVALAAENARLRAMLARAGVDAERALADAAAHEETRQARDDAADTAAGHARELEVGRAELADAEVLNDELCRANVALGESEDRYRAVLESATDYAIITKDRQGRITGWNAGARNVLGWSESEVLRQDAGLIFTPEDRDAGAPEAEMRAALEHGTAADERWHMRRDGTRFWAQGQLTPLRDGNGGLRGFLKILRDRTEQRAAERECERLLAMLGQSQTMVCDWQGRIEVWSQGMERLLGFTAAEAVSVLARELLRSEYPAPWAEIVSALRREGRWVGEVRHWAKDGSPKVVQATWLVQPGLNGEPSSLVVAVEDQTDARRAEAALRESEGRLRLALDVGGLGDFEWDLRTDTVQPSARARAIFGFGPGEGERPADYFARTVPEDRERIRAAVAARLVTGWAAFSYRIRLPDGTVRHVHSQGDVVRGADGAPTRVVGVFADETERMTAEVALRESEARFRHMADSAPALIWMTDETGAFTFANMHFDHLFGRPAADFLGDGWREVLLPDEAERFPAAFMAAFRAREPFRAEVRVRDRDGRVRWLRCEGVPRTDDAGRFLGYTGCDLDITEARLAAEELERRVEARTGELRQAVDALHAEALEREQAEASLRQSQKMEAVGQLTGGIAHDFNNMLQAIAGSLELMGRRIGQGRAEEAERHVEGARRTVERAAALTHRLLAFARRQALQPRPVNPDELVEGMAELIRRTVGPGVGVELRLGDGTWPVQCDPNQLESALLNLCINARDAMPDGGRLAIATRHVRLAAADVADQEDATAGEYVEVAVADTGAGMDEATQARVFEPFFTTKPLGQGTGLGLSQLYGFVRQSYGVVRLDSAPGQGTTVCLYLPRHRQAGASDDEGNELGAGSEPETTDIGADAGSGTVLLVEDEASVRASVAEHLRELGCTVLEAEDGPAALRALQGSLGAYLDMLVTDVGLPNGLNGRQVADAARERRPGLPVLFITGFAGTVLEGQLAPGMAVIGKPFTLDALAARVRAMIEGEGVNRRGIGTPAGG